MASLSSPPGLLSSSFRRRQRHQKLAGRRALERSNSDSDTSCIDGESLSSSGVAFTRSHDSNEDSLCGETSCMDCDAWYIGEHMCHAECQTDLSTSPHEQLAYAADPEVLLGAVVHNALVDLHHHVQACIAHAHDLLNENVFIDDVLDSETGKEYEVVSLDIDCQTMQWDIRLCSLRCEKVVKAWQQLYSKAKLEAVSESDGYSDCFSLIAHDAEDLCTYMGDIMRATQSSGVWTLGLAVRDIFMEQFGHVEGEASVLEHMQCLGIRLDGEPKPILQLALQMVVNNRCDVDDETIERL